jgi:ecotin
VRCFQVNIGYAGSFSTPTDTCIQLARADLGQCGPGDAQNITVRGHTRYVFANLRPLAGTQAASDPVATKIKPVVSLSGAPCLIRYNSKLLVVIYVPTGAELRYRIRAAQALAQPIEEG